MWFKRLIKFLSLFQHDVRLAQQFVYMLVTKCVKRRTFCFKICTIWPLDIKRYTLSLWICAGIVLKGGINKKISVWKPLQMIHCCLFIFNIKNRGFHPCSCLCSTCAMHSYPPRKGWCICIINADTLQTQCAALLVRGFKFPQSQIPLVSASSSSSQLQGCII